MKESTHSLILATLLGILIGGFGVYLFTGRYQMPSTAPVVAQVADTSTPEPTATPTMTPSMDINVFVLPSITPWPSATAMEWCSYFQEHGTEADIGRKCRKDPEPVTPTPTRTPVPCSAVDGNDVCTWQGERDETTESVLEIPSEWALWP